MSLVGLEGDVLDTLFTTNEFINPYTMHLYCNILILPYIHTHIFVPTLSLPPSLLFSPQMPCGVYTDFEDVSSKSGCGHNEAVDIDLKSIPTPNGQFSGTSVASLSSFLPSLNYRLDDRGRGITRNGDEI